MQAHEGSATISDSAGRLLFYTDGETIYNKNHQVMRNGDQLLGHFSSFQSSIIIRQPNSTQIFYVFTSDANENDFKNGYHYSIVDMSKDNGNGEVVSKNNLLKAPGTERLTAIRHGNSIDVWILTNDWASNVFRAWLLTCNGLVTTPVVSTAGEKLDAHRYMNIGCLKASADGKKLCQTHFADQGSEENFFQLFDFDNESGKVFNSKKISIPKTRYYGCEFSPNSQLLYLTKGDVPEVDQFESNLSTIAVVNSRASLPAVKNLYGIQLGPDQRIYLAKSGAALSVIKRPNSKGVDCLLDVDNITLGGKTSGIGLPARINDAHVGNFTYRLGDSCKGDFQFFGNTGLKGELEWHWDFGDGHYSNLKNPVHTFVGTTRQVHTITLTVKSKGTCGFVRFTQNIVGGGLLVQPDFDYKQRCDSSFVEFTNKTVVFPDTAVINYTWELAGEPVEDSIQPRYHYTSPGEINVKLKASTSNGCLDDSLSKLINIRILDLQVPINKTINVGESVQLFASGGANQFEWSPSTWLSDSTIQNPVAVPLKNITYTVKAKDDLGCTDTDSVSIQVLNLDGIFVPNGFTPNNDGLNDVLKPTLGVNYELLGFSVYNRWGERIFFTQRKGHGWDGQFKKTQQSSDTYLWVLSVKHKSGAVYQTKGTAHLIH